MIHAGGRLASCFASSFRFSSCGVRYFVPWERLPSPSAVRQWATPSAGTVAVRRARVPGATHSQINRELATVNRTHHCRADRLRPGWGNADGSNTSTSSGSRSSGRSAESVRPGPHTIIPLRRTNEVLQRQPLLSAEVRDRFDIPMLQIGEQPARERAGMLHLVASCQGCDKRLRELFQANFDFLKDSRCHDTFLRHGLCPRNERQRPSHGLGAQVRLQSGLD